MWIYCCGVVAISLEEEGMTHWLLKDDIVRMNMFAPKIDVEVNR